VPALRVSRSIRFFEYLLDPLEQRHGDDRFVQSAVALALPQELARVDRVPEDSMDFRFPMPSPSANRLCVAEIT
jgi:hypothetical protein